MFYEPRDGHGLRRNPFKALVVPRPIGWISTLSQEGVPNLAPYSFFNALADEPPMVMFSSNGDHPHGAKDSAANAIAAGEFVVNLATWDLRHAMNASSEIAPPEVDEFALAGLTAAPCRVVAAPRVKEAPASLECRVFRHVDLPHWRGERNVMVIGEVVGVHIDERVMTDGFVDTRKVKPIARLGYREYAVVTEPFEMDRPAGGDAVIGMGGPPQ
jgi:flavin reductase (DIM6/NTAB) family NADH-FMN oxidoreductase RutF